VSSGFFENSPEVLVGQGDEKILVAENSRGRGNRVSLGTTSTFRKPGLANVLVWLNIA
jgi:hypothetical protein